MITTVGKGMTKVDQHPNAREVAPHSQREVPDQLSQMDTGLDRLLEMIQVLELRLDPVLRPTCPQSANDVSKPLQASRFGDVLQGFNSRIQSLTDRIADLERRTEL